MLPLLQRITAHPDTDSIDGLVELVHSLRPAKPHQVDQATANVRALIQLLQANHSYAIALRHYLLRVFSAQHHTSLYTDTGILSSNGFSPSCSSASHIVCCPLQWMNAICVTVWTGYYL